MAEAPGEPDLQAIRSAFGLLTQLPLGEGHVRPESLGRAVGYFPLVGLALGAIAGVTALLLSTFLPPWPAAIGVTALLALMTGGLHLDGLADTADGLGGGRGDRARSLRIMRDSRLGSFGAVALVIVLMGKVAALASLLDPGVPAGRIFWALVLMSCAGRWCAVLLIRLFPYARREGLGRRFREGSGEREFLVATIIFIAALLVAGEGGWGAGLIAAAAALSVGGWARSRLGGLTGDVYGAGIEVSELVFLWIFLG